MFATQVFVVEKRRNVEFISHSARLWSVFMTMWWLQYNYCKEMVYELLLLSYKDIRTPMSSVLAYKEYLLRSFESWSSTHCNQQHLFADTMRKPYREVWISTQLLKKNSISNLVKQILATAAVLSKDQLQQAEHCCSHVVTCCSASHKRDPAD